MTLQPLTEKYRPGLLSDIRGQAGVVRGLAGFVRRPSSRAFLFSGATGTGKTAAALALAAELGVVVHGNEAARLMGGLVQIASGEQTAETVREKMRACHLRPMFGSGWRVLVVNEADFTSAAAAVVWLDTLERLPEKTVVIFTTNAPEKFPKRFRDRCEHYRFESDAGKLWQAAQELVAAVWAAELGGRTDAPRVEDLPDVVEDGALSFRAVLQALEPLIRAELPELPEPKITPCPAMAGDEIAAPRASENVKAASVAARKPEPAKAAVSEVVEVNPWAGGLEAWAESARAA